MKINSEGWVDEASHVQSAHFGAVITPTLVVLHETAGPLEQGNAVAYLRENARQASAHFVIERDGSITQMVSCLRRANHAGASSYYSRDGCNGFSIGIEFVGPGKMTPLSGSQVVTWWGAVFDGVEDEVFWAETDAHGAGYWMRFTAEQIAAGLRLLEALFAAYGTLRDIRGHWYVSPGRKVDPNPLFPMDQVRAEIMGDLADLIHPDDGQERAPELYDCVLVDAPGDEDLNMRRWPSFAPNVIGKIPDGVAVPVLKEGIFDGRLWLKVLYGGKEGWVVARYTAPICFEAVKGGVS